MGEMMARTSGPETGCGWTAKQGLTDAFTAPDHPTAGVGLAR